MVEDIFRHMVRIKLGTQHHEPTLEVVNVQGKILQNDRNITSGRIFMEKHSVNSVSVDIIDRSRT